MKSIPIILALLACASAALAGDVTLAGKYYYGAEWGPATSRGVYIYHRDGSTLIPFGELPATQQQRVEQARKDAAAAGGSPEVRLWTDGRPSPFVIQNVVVKHVLASGILGTQAKYRYFFSIRNIGTSDYAGQFSVTLVNGMPELTTVSETFDGPLPMGVSKVFYLDAHTGPARVHGEACIAEYLCAFGAGENTPKMRGAITERFEDTTGGPR